MVLRQIDRERSAGDIEISITLIVKNVYALGTCDFHVHRVIRKSVAIVAFNFLVIWQI